jgi:D-alanyl-D-alanine-carboxypeptidase/D-alanyl-D-alanine-endopeptidase
MKKMRRLIKLALIGGGLLVVGVAALLIYVLHTQHRYKNLPDSRYLPNGIASPQKNGREITLAQLATHTSGLPRLPDNLDRAVTDEQNPYAHYQAADLYQALTTVKLSAAPGKKSDYSNYGFGLLGHILELKAGKPYEALVTETLCAPLGMSNTVIQLSPEQKARLAPGHDPKGAPVANWDFAVLAGCGAFRSNASDLLRFLEANLKDTASPISKALADAQKFHFKTFGGGVGLGWQIEETIEEQILHWHNGGTGGYVSFLGFDRAHQVGVVILSNYGDAWAGDSSVDSLGMEILKWAPKISWE